MKRVCIVNNGLVVNIIDYENSIDLNEQLPGLGPDFVGVESQTAQIGWSYSNGQFSAPAPSGDLSERRASVWGHIKALRTEKQNGGVFVAGKWFHTDQSSRIQQLGLVLINGDLAPGIMWKTMDGSFVEMTNEIAGQLLAAVSQLDIQAYTCAEGHKSALYASNNPEAYDYSTGWPAVYVP